MYFLKRIKQSIKNKENRVRLYRIKDTPYVGGIESKEYLEVLESMKEGFIEAEMYEYAQECQEVINSIHIDKLIIESQKL